MVLSFWSHLSPIIRLKFGSEPHIITPIVPDLNLNILLWIIPISILFGLSCYFLEAHIIGLFFFELNILRYAHLLEELYLQSLFTSLATQNTKLRSSYDDRILLETQRIL
jgi:hypothetical protein